LGLGVVGYLAVFDAAVELVDQNNAMFVFVQIKVRLANFLFGSFLFQTWVASVYDQILGMSRRQEAHGGPVRTVTHSQPRSRQKRSDKPFPCISESLFTLHKHLLVAVDVQQQTHEWQLSRVRERKGKSTKTRPQ